MEFSNYIFNKIKNFREKKVGLEKSLYVKRNSLSDQIQLML